MDNLKCMPVAVGNHASLPIENVNKRMKSNSLTCIELHAQSYVRVCQNGMQGDLFTLVISNSQNKGRFLNTAKLHLRPTSVFIRYLFIHDPKFLLQVQGMQVTYLNNTETAF